MNKTELSLEVSDNSNANVMRLFDTSNYSTEETAENYFVEVLPVNKDRWVLFNVSKGFSLVLNSSNLRYNQVSDVAKLIALPDGIYEIKQSVKPNVSTLSHIYHFRVTEMSNKLKRERVKLFDFKCNKQEFLRSINKLRDVEEYMDGAKWMVEEGQDKKRGKEMYDFATKQLEQYTNECQC